MLNEKLNFYKLLSNYLLCKTKDDFLNSKSGNFDSSDLSLISGLVTGFKSLNYNMSSSVRYKTYVAYLLSILSRYFKSNTEDSFYEIVTTLLNTNADRIVDFVFLEQLRSLLIKKTKCLIKENFFEKYKDKIEDVIDDYEERIVVLEQNENLSDSYSNDMFYDDLNDLVKQNVNCKHSSLIYEISKMFDLTKEDQELDLIDCFVSYKKRKPNKLSDEEFYSTINSNNGSKLVDNTPLNKKLKLSDLTLEDKIESLPNIDKTKNQPTAEPTENNYHQQQEQEQEQELAFDEPTSSRLEKTRIENNEPGTSESSNNNASENIDKTNKQKTQEKSEQTKKPFRRLRVLDDVDLLNFDTSDDDFDFNQSPNQKAKQLNSLLNKKKYLDTNPTNTSSPKPNLSKSDTKKSKQKNDDTDDSSVASQTAKPKNKIEDSSDDSDDSSVVADKIKTKAKKKLEDLKENTEDELNEEKEKQTKAKQNETESEIENELVNKIKRKNSLDLNTSDEDLDMRSRKSVNESKLSTKRQKWTEVETVYLVAGVELYAKGNWSKILNRFSSKFSNRTSVHLKDKYRNLEKCGELKRYEKQAKVLLDKLSK